MTIREKLREYLRHTPTNSNPNVVESYVNDIVRLEGGGDLIDVEKVTDNMHEPQKIYRTLPPKYPVGTMMLVIDQTALEELQYVGMNTYSIGDIIPFSLLLANQFEHIMPGITKYEMIQEGLKAQDNVQHLQSSDLIAQIPKKKLVSGEPEDPTQNVSLELFYCNNTPTILWQRAVKQDKENLDLIEILILEFDLEAEYGYPFRGITQDLSKLTIPGLYLYFDPSLNSQNIYVGSEYKDIYHYNTNVSKWYLAGQTEQNSLYHDIIAKTIQTLTSKDLQYLGSIHTPGYISLPNCSMCKDLTSILFTDITENNTVLAVNNSAFEECSNLTEVKILNKISLEPAAFFLAERLQKVYVPNLVQQCALDIFSGCSALTEVILPKQLLVVDTNAFSSCALLSKVFFMGLPSDYTSLQVQPGNEYFTAATKYYYSETQPTDTANKYWHFAPNGIDPVIW